MAKHKMPRLADCDLSSELAAEADYERELNMLQLDMLRIQQAYFLQRRRAIIAFEGWDAAGKGGAIRRLTEALDPRAVKVWPIARPSEAEKSIHYLHRFWTRLPEAGSIAIFDRSWYGRVLVERVENLTPKEAWKRAYREINEFERTLADDGVRIIKLFLHVSPKVQAERLRERMEVPYKRWKLAMDDFRNREMRPAYAEAIDEMFKRTHTDRARWHLVSGEHKWMARLQVLRIVTDALGRGIDLSPPKVNPAIKRAVEKLPR